MIRLNQSVLQLYHMQNYRKGLDWIIDSVVDCTINVSNFKPLSDSSCIKLPKKLKWMIYEIFDWDWKFEFFSIFVGKPLKNMTP